MQRKKNGLQSNMKRRALQVGFIPDADCAPIVVAQESGLFQKYELPVELRRETAWANIRDRIIHGDLDAAHAPATLPFIANLGLESDRCACVSGLVVSLQGNSIMISRQLWDEGVRDGRTLRDVIYRKWGRRTYTFGVAFPYSPAFFLLRQWLQAGGVFPRTEVRIVVLPPSQMYPTLKLGYIDGFCAGEPWVTLTMESRTGVSVATSADLAPLHPEKVLMVRRDFASERESEHERLIAALLEAAVFCERPENEEIIARMLAQKHYVNAPAECFKRCVAPVASEQSPQPPHASQASAAQDAMNLRMTGPIFHRHGANDPSDEKSAWLVTRLYELMESNLVQLPQLARTPVLRNVFRRDIFERAGEVMANQTRTLKAEVEQYQARAV